MAEILILNCFLFVALILAPLVTKTFFLKGSKAYSLGHTISLLILLCGALLNLDHTAVIWPLFCAWGFFLYLKNESKFIFSITGLARCIPFLFSLISSIWLIAGIYDLHLLGYNKAWSFYAALHGIFLGWIFVGCLAFIAGRKKSKKIYALGCYLSLVFFLFVAFGIDGVAYIKRIGVVGFSLLMPLLIGHYLFNLKKKNKLSMALSALSLFSIFLSMTLAILNEFWIGFPKIVADVPVMVLTHGTLNAFLAVPCFFLAIKFERHETSSH